MILRTIFNQPFLQSIKTLFAELKVPMNYVSDNPTTAEEILKDTYKDTTPFQFIDEVYFVGMVDDAAFDGNKSLAVDKIKSDYDGILVFGVTLQLRENNLLPTRGQLAEISRAFNREYYYTPVILVFKYRDSTNEYIAFAITERLQYKQSWREGEKAGKVTLLRDINIQNPHRGHNDILNALEIPCSGKNAVNSFDTLYQYWQTVFSVSLLNKKFYKELQNWYFWAIKEVIFPNVPMRLDYDTDDKFDEAVKEHKAKNVIRLLTRVLFIWFIKEKKLIPEELFDEQAIADKLILDFTPQKPRGAFATGKHNSQYYRAILQNLFFATLNQEMGKRGFRTDGKHHNVTNLMRYKSYFKDPDYFVRLMEEVVPFMNGGLFECLDKPHSTVKSNKGGDLIFYIDGFSDRAENELVVPDYLFFDLDEEVDLSDDFGNKVYKNSRTRGLLEILESYKFTITENTPIEEDVALDPELLGKVFENLLASYNPETKTTARKQTGSFYTPRDIVNYMVDESLIAYLKNASADWNITDEQLDESLHKLLSYDSTNPFQDKETIKKQIIIALDRCTILDPACGSGAFPMGMLQKMAHVLHKVDPNNVEWKQRQIDRVNKAIENIEEIDDELFRDQSVKELNAQKKDIEDAFNNNELDYGRKLYLIENCIYGVDIQSVATQISKLRFFISLIVDQKIDKTKNNFGIRPLPNLETKFITANTLISIEKTGNTQDLSDDVEVKKLQADLKKVRHKLFSSKAPTTKRQLREEDKEIRNKIAVLLAEKGWGNNVAKKLADWDPYDQNASSTFFDPVWMFGISVGFDIVIGNPPYLGNKEIGASNQAIYRKEYGFTDDMYNYFYHRGISLLGDKGVITYITPNTFLTLSTKKNLRMLFIKNILKELFLVGYVFDEAYVDTVISLIIKDKSMNYDFCYKIADKTFSNPIVFKDNIQRYIKSPDNIFYPPSKTNVIINSIYGDSLSKLYLDFRDVLFSQSSVKKNYRKILMHRESLRQGDLTLLGLISEGVQGLVTGNNSKYLARICENEIAEENITSELINKIQVIRGPGNYKGLSKNELYDLAEKVKLETNKPGIFGKFFIYKTVLQANVKYLHDLSEREQLNGSNTDECWIYYYRGNEDGLKWQVPFVEAINWTSIYVKELKGSVNTNSRWQGSEFYGQTGFGWVDYFTNQIKAFFVEKGPYSKNVVKFHSMINLSDKFFTAIINSKFITYYVRNFLTNTHTLQINDGKLIPFRYPTIALQDIFDFLVSIILIKQEKWVEKILDALVFELYFSDHMKERGIDVLQFIVRDINIILDGRVLEGLSLNEKEQVIEKLYLKWTHPDNEVRNRMKLFAVRSPEILKPILES